MAENNGHAGALGFEFEGKTYLLPREPDYDFELAFQAVLEDYAYRRLEARRARAEPAEYAQDREGLRRDCTASYYAWGTPAFWTFLGSREGAAELALLGMRWGVRHGGANPDPKLGRRLAAHREKWAELNELLGRWFPFPPGATRKPTTDEFSPGSAGSPSAGPGGTSSPAAAAGPTS